MAAASWNQRWHELQWEALVLQPAMRQAETSTLPSYNRPSDMLRRGDTVTDEVATGAARAAMEIARGWMSWKMLGGRRSRQRHAPCAIWGGMRERYFAAGDRGAAAALYSLMCVLCKQGREKGVI